MVPFEIVPVGPTEKGSVLMHLRESTINGVAADITFDTGAGTNVISPEMVDKYHLIPLDGTKVSVNGVARKEGYIAIAKELKMGNITITDVPFTVVSVSSNNSQADPYTDAFHIILGSELMLRLKEVNMDFASNKLIVPSTAPCIPVKTDAKPNICFSSSMNLLCRGSIHNESMLMCIDSGDASYGSIGNAFFERNKSFIADNGIRETIRMAGIGGVNFIDCYKLSNMELSLGNHTIGIPEIAVKTEQEAGNGGLYECNIGLKTLILFDSVKFNLVDFVLTTEISKDYKSSLTQRQN
jgi:hypothetical protein